MEFTLSILKPDAIKKNISGKIISLLEENGLKIIASRMMCLTEKQAQDFYEIHKERPFFTSLVTFMTSAPCLILVLKGEDAVNLYRKIMGNTNPSQADKGTIRAQFADSIEANCVHGSDSLENAKKEISFFFAECDLIK